MAARAASAGGAAPGGGACSRGVCRRGDASRGHACSTCADPRSESTTRAGRRSGPAACAEAAVCCSRSSMRMAPRGPIGERSGSPAGRSRSAAVASLPSAAAGARSSASCPRRRWRREPSRRCMPGDRTGRPPPAWASARRSASAAPRGEPPTARPAAPRSPRPPIGHHRGRRAPAGGRPRRSPRCRGRGRPRRSARARRRRRARGSSARTAPAPRGPAFPVRARRCAPADGRGSARPPSPSPARPLAPAGRRRAPRRPAWRAELDACEDCCSCTLNISN